MDRREFLVRATIGGITVPLLVRELGCDGNGGPGPDPGGSTTFPSQEVQGHSHSITLPDSDLTAGTGRSYTSTSSVGHTHTVSLSTADFATLNRGCRVITVSGGGGSGNHTHLWEIRYPSKVSDITRTSAPDGTGHSHDVTVVAGDINAAPSSRIYDTTESNPGPHTHKVTLNQSHFETLQNCGTVTITSSQDPSDQHTHSFSITPA